MLLPCAIDTTSIKVVWIVLWSNQKIDALGASSADWHALLQAEFHWQKTAMQTVAQNEYLESGDPGSQQRIEWECWSKQALPLFFLQLNLVCMWRLLHLQEDIQIFRVSLILLDLSLTWYLCAISLQNTPFLKRHWSPSVAIACVWGQYLCCSVTILVNFLTLTCCFKMSYNMGTPGIFSSLSTSRCNEAWLVSFSHPLSESALSSMYQ